MKALRLGQASRVDNGDIAGAATGNAAPDSGQLLRRTPPPRITLHSSGVPSPKKSAQKCTIVHTRPRPSHYRSSLHPLLEICKLSERHQHDRLEHSPWYPRLIAAWSNVSNQPPWLQGCAAGCRPTSAAVLALASGKKGRPPYMWAYHAMDPTEAAVAPAMAVRDARKGAVPCAWVDADRAYALALHLGVFMDCRC